MNKILITGITGQDGIFLANELLKNKKNLIYGCTRSLELNKFYSKLNYLNSKNDLSRLSILNIELINYTETVGLIKTIKPDYLYHLSGPSSVYESIKNTGLKKEINIIFHNLINACIEIKKFPNFFQASSSEMFGINKNYTLSEIDAFLPNSPYAEAKLKIHNSLNSLREKYEWNISSGIMFNHESEFRNDEYLIMKIINYVLNKEFEYKKLEIGSLDLSRDWSYAQEIMQAAILINENNKNEDFVLGSGNSRKISEVLEIVFSKYNLSWQDYAIINDSLLRKNDPIFRQANADKIFNQLGWKHESSLEQIIDKIFKYKYFLRN